MTIYFKITKLTNVYIRWSLINMRHICQSKPKEGLRGSLWTWLYAQFLVVVYLHSIWDTHSGFILTGPWDAAKCCGGWEKRRCQTAWPEELRGRTLGITRCSHLTLLPSVLHPPHPWTHKFCNTSPSKRNVSSLSMKCLGMGKSQRIQEANSH